MGRVQGTPTLPYPSLPPLSTMNGGCHQINLRHVKSKCHYDAPWKTPTAVVCLAPVLCHRRRRRYQAAAATRPPRPWHCWTQRSPENERRSLHKNLQTLFTLFSTAASYRRTRYIHSLTKCLEYLQFQRFFLSCKTLRQTVT